MFNFSQIEVISSFSNVKVWKYASFREECLSFLRTNVPNMAAKTGSTGHMYDKVQKLFLVKLLAIPLLLTKKLKPELAPSHIFKIRIFFKSFNANLSLIAFDEILISSPLSS